MIRKTLHLLLLLFVAAAASPCSAQNNQSNVGTALLYSWPAVTTTGQLEKDLFFNGSNVARPLNYTIDFAVTGTAPTACTYRIEGSYDEQTWYGLDATAPASTSCVASNMVHISFKPVLYLRINIVSYTAGDGTTKVVFHYAGGRS